MAAEQPIPVFTDLEKLYTNLGVAAEHAPRWEALATSFKERFGRLPAFIARAPGRVNLIGEHIDYALFGVLPAAVERDILIASAPRSPGNDAAGLVRAENLDGKYQPQVFSPNKDDAAWTLDIDQKQLRWESYVKAGYYGVLDRFFDPTKSSEAPNPADILVTGTVPAGSGLSSSAAMVVASTLTFLAINEKLDGLTKGQLTEIAVENECRVGVNSGGMDQAASVISSPGSALYISFFPTLAASPVQLPARASFVIMHSRVVADKLVSSRTGYNLRVVETLAAARALAKTLGVALDAGGVREKVTLREVLGRWIGIQEHKGNTSPSLSAEDLRAGLERILPELEALRSSEATSGVTGVTYEEMVMKTGLTEAEFRELYLVFEVEATRFELYKRAKHVYEEALRVLQFRDVCLANSDDAIEQLGALMNASQVSCSEQFECSHPRLDQLTSIARAAGARGARLTGAGWGGCAVALVDEDQVESFIKHVAQEYEPYHELEGEALREVLFATKPSSGASVYRFTE